MNKANNHNGIDSHIQVPKGIIKFFESKDQAESHYLWNYDVKTKKIKKSHPKTLNVEHGYYSAETEKYLDNQIEDPYIKVVKKLSCYFDSHSDDENFMLNQSDLVETVRNYAYALIQRHPVYQEQLSSENEILGLLNKQTQRYFIVNKGIEYLKQYGKFNDFGFTLLLNNTDIPFVLTMSGMTAFKESKYGIILLISATPKISFLFIQNKDELILKSENDRTLVRMFDLQKNEVDFIDNKLFLRQLNCNYGFVASPSRDILEEMIKNHKTSLLSESEVTTTLDQSNPSKLTPAQKAELDALSNLSDEDARKEAEADPDCEPLDKPSVGE